MVNRRGRAKRARGYVFTLHHFTSSDILRLRDLGRRAERITYLVFGREYGEQTNRRHLQGYLYFKNPITLGGAKQCIGNPTVHVEAQLGTGPQASEYCKKSGDYEEFGRCPAMGRRTDLEQIRIQIESGASDMDIASASFSRWCMYRRAFAEYRRLVQSDRSRRVDLKVIVLHGDAGVGKTRLVWERAERLGKNIWASSTPDLKWFDGYEGEEVVLIDDFRGGCEVGWFFRVLDIYPLQVPIKGGFVEWRPKEIWITSNLHPDHWFPTLFDKAPLYRRLHHMVECIDIDYEQLCEKVDSLLN